MKKYLLGILALIVSIIGVYLGWQQFQSSKETEMASRPNVVVCLRSISYEKSNTRGSGDDAVSVPKGRASIRLLNKGTTQVTVSRVVLNPWGTRSDGQDGGLGSINIEVSKVVPGNGVVSIDNLEFVADFGVKERFWIDKPEIVYTWADWPSGSGLMLKCISRDGQWSCGRGSDSVTAFLVDSACR